MKVDIQPCSRCSNSRAPGFEMTKSRQQSHRQNTEFVMRKGTGHAAAGTYCNSTELLVLPDMSSECLTHTALGPTWETRQCRPLQWSHQPCSSLRFLPGWSDAPSEVHDKIPFPGGAAPHHLYITHQLQMRYQLHVLKRARCNQAQMLGLVHNNWAEPSFTLYSVYLNHPWVNVAGGFN